MIALDFIDRGVRFDLGLDGSLAVRGPVGAAELLDRLRAQVERRIPLLATMPEPRQGLCGCGDETESDEACELCVLAQQRAAERAPATAPKPRPAKSKRAVETSIHAPWSFVIAECPERLTEKRHADRMHLAGDEGAVCVERRLPERGERLTEAWVTATAHREPYLETDVGSASGWSVRWRLGPGALILPERDQRRAAAARAAQYADLRARDVLRASPDALMMAHLTSLRERGLLPADFAIATPTRSARNCAPPRRREAA